MYFLYGNGVVMNGTRVDSDLKVISGHFMLVDNNLLHSRCPLCGANDIMKVGNIDYFQPLTFSTIELSLKRKPELWKCKECRSGFTQYAIPEKIAAALYASGVGGERWISKPFEEEKTAVVIKILENAFSSECRVLDVGCNTGELLDFARSRGCLTAGVEYSEDSRAIVKAKGHECYSTIDDVIEEFDVITGVDLVEHLYYLPKFFALCRQRLRNHGQLIVLTGNISCLSSRLTGSGWWYVRFPEHVVFPSQSFFSSMTMFSAVTCTRTYAANKYRSSLWNNLFCLFKGIQYRNYTAQPSFVSDHIVVVLNK
jgi:2-polyprenyl-3-methyl-5-hydroxy-6-metoxy-1,4-benzoquinol methylase